MRGIFLLSTIIITKNESHNIQRAISSVWDISDEIVVVDHDSSNGTAFLAEEAGARVIQRNNSPIPIDFSNMWNYAIKQAKYEKVFILAADECIHEKDIKHLKLLAEENLLVQFQIFTFFPTLDYYVDTWFPNIQTRMFPKVCYYRGRINETNNLYYENQKLPHRIREGDSYGQLYHYGWLNRSWQDYKQKLQWSELPDSKSIFKSLGLAKFENTSLTHPKVLKRFPLRIPQANSLSLEDLQADMKSADTLDYFNKKVNQNERS